MDQLPKLTPESLEAFMAQLNDDPALKLAIIQRINEVGLVAVLAEHFQLSPEQKEFLEQLSREKGPIRLWEQLITGALLMGGSISLVQETDRSTDGTVLSTDVGVHVGPDGVDVSVHC